MGGPHRLPGSYWVTADDGRARFACGDLAGLRPVYYTPTGEWATDVQCLGYRLVPDLALLAARIVAGGHWPERSVYEGIGLVPGGYGLLLEPGQAPRLVDIKAIDPVPDLATGARRFGATLTQAVQERVRAAGTAVGADLSGGLDSSSAAILAAEVGDVHAVTYTDRYTSTEDETLAARLAEHAGLLRTVTFGGDGELPFSFPPGQPTGDEPTLDAAVYAMDRAYLKPVAGLPLHLTGHGGDVVLDAIHLGQPHPIGDAAIHQAAEAAGADSVIAALPGGLDTSLARSWWGGHDLSGGQWQRPAIARAFHRGRTRPRPGRAHRSARRPSRTPRFHPAQGPFPRARDHLHHPPARQRTHRRPHHRPRRRTCRGDRYVHRTHGTRERVTLPPDASTPGRRVTTARRHDVEHHLVGEAPGGQG
ncbi:asparagine synthase-related protein [Streptomyces sp. NPDC048717]|uniref:asparagine synthase-related protein n=1 Tax=Streptomyces sp. NPDC048717 TaxID=3154928 RepID=UPI00342EA369